MGSWGPSAETFGVIFTMLPRSTPAGDGEVRKQVTAIIPMGLLESHLMSLQLGPPYSGGLQGSAQLPTQLPPCLGRAQQPRPHGGVGCGGLYTLAPANGSREVLKLHTSITVRDTLCLVG